MNLNNYKSYYVHDEGHWYISKIKQYSEKSIGEMARGLRLFWSLLGPRPSTEVLAKYESFVSKTVTQKELFPYQPKQVLLQTETKLYLSLQILENDLVDVAHLRTTNQAKYEVFQEMRIAFSGEERYEYFVHKYGLPYLSSELIVYYRNFDSWLSKYGFYGVERSGFAFITETGEEFIRVANSDTVSSAIFGQQIRKYQVWNPTIDNKYAEFKVVPYFMILDLLFLIPDHKISREEYVLFVTKIRSHDSQAIQKAIDLIVEFRALSESDQRTYVASIENLDKSIFPDRPRTNYSRLKDSSGKEIHAYTFGGVSTWDAAARAIKLNDQNRAAIELEEFKKGVGYIGFNNEHDWIRVLGRPQGLT